MTYALKRGPHWVASPPLHRPALSLDRAAAYPYWDLDDALEAGRIIRWAFGFSSEVRSTRPVMGRGDDR